jgi:DNA modification methylase
MGSGSTGVACLNTERNFIGIEDKEETFLLAQNRIQLPKTEVTHED